MSTPMPATTRIPPVTMSGTRQRLSSMAVIVAVTRACPRHPPWSPSSRGSAGEGRREARGERVHDAAVRRPVGVERTAVRDLVRELVAGDVRAGDRRPDSVAHLV